MFSRGCSPTRIMFSAGSEKGRKAREAFGFRAFDLPVCDHVAVAAERRGDFAVGVHTKDFVLERLGAEFGAAECLENVAIEDTRVHLVRPVNATAEDGRDLALGAPSSGHLTSQQHSLSYSRSYCVRERREPVSHTPAFCQTSTRGLSVSKNRPPPSARRFDRCSASILSVRNCSTCSGCTRGTCDERSFGLGGSPPTVRTVSGESPPSSTPNSPLTSCGNLALFVQTRRERQTRSRGNIMYVLSGM
ncbi:hypothetical protein KC341_g11 [Hortaea werneckii]|nr:hypothetical protein KC341_g11 [Hortaea werneckii]